ncbi:MAG: type II secretion system major pseudopilin GspG [Candidatus Omnitrophica bacterium]|nr:type II secretion system major pseudopilin GspG [Candidatus Omnitrophota bacterium]
MRSRSRMKGVTLIELMLVVIIIGVLIAMVMPRLAGRSEQARMVAAMADIESNISVALDMYELDNGNYPPDLDALIKEPTPEPPNWNGPYLKKNPMDPWGQRYNYKLPGEHNENSYDLWSNGKDHSEGGGDDITNWSDEESEEEA